MEQFKLNGSIKIDKGLAVDERYIQPDLAARDALIGSGREFEGLSVYVLSDQTTYIYKGATSGWEETSKMAYNNSWNADNNTPELGPTGNNNGDVYKVSAAGVSDPNNGTPTLEVLSVPVSTEFEGTYVLSTFKGTSSFSGITADPAYNIWKKDEGGGIWSVITYLTDASTWVISTDQGLGDPDTWTTQLWTFDPPFELVGSESITVKGSLSPSISTSVSYIGLPAYNINDYIIFDSDTNTWDILSKDIQNVTGSNVLIVDPSGNDSTAIKGTNSYWATPAAAVAAAIEGDTIIVYPGTYVDQVNLAKHNVRWHFHYGAIITNTIDGKVFQQGGNLDYVVTGLLDIIHNPPSLSQHVFEIQNAQDVYIEVNNITTYNGHALRTKSGAGRVYFKANEIISGFYTCVYIGGYQTNDTITVEVNKAILRDIGGIGDSIDMLGSIYIAQCSEVYFKGGKYISEREGRPALLEQNVAFGVNGIMEFENCLFAYNVPGGAAGQNVCIHLGLHDVAARIIYSGTTQIYNSDLTGLGIDLEGSGGAGYAILGDVYANTPIGGSEFATANFTKPTYEYTVDVGFIPRNLI